MSSKAPTNGQERWRRVATGETRKRCGGLCVSLGPCRGHKRTRTTGRRGRGQWRLVALRWARRRGRCDPTAASPWPCIAARSTSRQNHCVSVALGRHPVRPRRGHSPSHIPRYLHRTNVPIVRHHSTSLKTPEYPPSLRRRFGNMSLVSRTASVSNLYPSNVLNDGNGDLLDTTGEPPRAPLRRPRT